MIELPQLTPLVLEELGKELGGCDFSDVNQMEFLSAVDSRDVQAAPGNGKTTLLVAKLVLLSRTWVSRSQGVCVISHTNAAREEVQRRLSGHPAASGFLAYPHFIGTVTSFLDRFLALPYLRGLGWHVHRIDDDAFAGVALSRWRRKPALIRYARGRERALTGFVSSLELADDFICEPGIAPLRLALKHQLRQPGPQSDSGLALEELKAELVNDGYYRFGDLLALANQALEKCPDLVQRIRARFPLVLLDEAQDTTGAQLVLLNQLFGQGIAFQRLGDENQALYEDETEIPGGRWRASNDAIPLNQTRRFGADLAAFASRLSARAPQEIVSHIDRQTTRTLILFNDVTIIDVLPKFAQEVNQKWRGDIPEDLDVRAVASRHSPTRDRAGGWPKTLVHYCPTYRGGQQRDQRSLDRFCIVMRQASNKFLTQATQVEVVDLIELSLTRIAKLLAITSLNGTPISKRNLWSSLSSLELALPLAVRRVIRDNILRGDAPWEPVAWEQFCTDLVTAMGFRGELTPRCREFFEYIPFNDIDRAATQEHEQSPTVYRHEGVSVQLGSIHSVKGKTVDAILVMETEVYRGRALHDRAMDLEITLPHAFGIEAHDFTQSDAHLAAATNIFVAITRPRHMVALALRREVVNDALLEAALRQGWEIRDLTVAEPT